MLVIDGRRATLRLTLSIFVWSAGAGSGDACAGGWSCTRFLFGLGSGALADEDARGLRLRRLRLGSGLRDGGRWLGARFGREGHGRGLLDGARFAGDEIAGVELVVVVEVTAGPLRRLLGEEKLVAIEDRLGLAEQVDEERLVGDLGDLAEDDVAPTPNAATFPRGHRIRTAALATLALPLLLLRMRLAFGSALRADLTAFACSATLLALTTATLLLLARGPTLGSGPFTDRFDGRLRRRDALARFGGCRRVARLLRLRLLRGGFGGLARIGLGRLVGRHRRQEPFQSALALAVECGQIDDGIVGDVALRGPFRVAL